MAAAGEPIFDAIESAYDEINDNFEDYAEGMTASQLSQLRDNWRHLTDTYLAAQAKALSDGSATVVQLTAELAAATAQVQAQKSDLSDTVATIGLVTELVKLAASLVRLAAVA